MRVSRWNTQFIKYKNNFVNAMSFQNMETQCVCVSTWLSAVHVLSDLFNFVALSTTHKTWMKIEDQDMIRYTD